MPPSTRVRQEDHHEFEARLRYGARPCLKTNKPKSQGFSSVVLSLPGKHKVLSSIPYTKNKPTKKDENYLNVFQYIKKKMVGMVAHTSNPALRRPKQEDLQVQDQHGGHSEFNASLNYIANPCLKSKKFLGYPYNGIITQL